MEREKKVEDSQDSDDDESDSESDIDECIVKVRKRNYICYDFVFLFNSIPVKENA